jgi:hypothetical protein
MQAKSMRTFVRGLGRFADRCREDLSGFRFKEQFLDVNFKDLQQDVKRSLLGAPKPKPVDGCQSAVQSRLRLRPDGRRLPLPPLGGEAPRLASATQLEPAPFPVRHYALPAHPCTAAARLYRPKARERMLEDRFEMIDEYIKYPSPDGALELDGRIDPVLRVGAFAPDEMKWNGRVPISVL